MNPYNYLDYWSRAKPLHLAIGTRSLEINYLTLKNIVDDLTSRLTSSGVKEGSLVVTCFRSKSIDWILTLALMKLSCSTVANHGYSHLNDFPEIDWILSDQKIPYETQANRLILQNNLSIDSDGDMKNLGSNVKDEYLERFFLTSGTTGTPKMVGRGLAQILDNAKTFCTLNNNYASTLDLMRLSAGGGLNQAMATLISGSTLYCAKNSKVAYEVIKKYQIKSLHGSPTQIGPMVKYMIENNLPHLNLDIVRYTGAQASDKLISNIKKYYLTRSIYLMDQLKQEV